MFVHITVGSDTYGRVKSVNGLPVVTKFGMFNFLPLFPLASYYYFGGMTKSSSGIPLLASSTKTTFSALELARLDAMSVSLAYIRGIFATFFILGFLAIIPVIMYLTGEFLDAFAMAILRAMLFCFVFGLVGGVCTYLVPTTSRREKMVRLNCHRIFGLAIDPVKLHPQDAIKILEFAQGSGNSNQQSMNCWDLALLKNRVTVAREGNSPKLDSELDELLTKLPNRNMQ